MRGDREIVDACQGYDKVHLCRNLVCHEEGQHFKEYGLARDFDGERFHLKNAELGAAKAGRTLWTWLRASSAKPPKPLKEFGSESETEPVPRHVVLIVSGWQNGTGTADWRANHVGHPGTVPPASCCTRTRFDELGSAWICALSMP